MSIDVRRDVLGCAARLAVALAGLFALGVLGSSRSYAAPLAQTFVMTVAGQSNFNTYSAPEPVYSGFFGLGGVSGVSIPSVAFSNPALLAPAGVAGNWRQQSAASGPLADTMSLSTSFNAGANTYAGTAAASVQFGRIGAQAQGTLGGPVQPGLVRGSESYGLVRDPLDFFSPTIVANGGTGFARYRFTIDGSLSIVGPGTADIEVLYQRGTQPIYTLMRAQVDSSSGTFIASLAGTATNASGFGYTSAIGASTASLSGIGDFLTYFEPFAIGAPVDFTFGMLAYAIASSNGSADASFFATARLTGIEVYDPFGRPVTDFVITSGSGTLYDANGAHPASVVPEPASALLALFGCGIFMARFRKAVSHHAIT